MAILRERKQRSKILQLTWVRSLNKEDKVLKRKASCLKQITPKNNAANAKSVESESVKPKRIKRATEESVYHNSESQLSVLERAKEVEASLEQKFPRLIKVMLPSHVAGGFWLGLPKKFCRQHLPKDDTMISLEDERGEKYETKYLAEKVGLSGGWRGFSIAHQLVEGDVLVFHRVARAKFKVYIIRSKSSDEWDCALGNMNQDVCIKETDNMIEENSASCEEVECEDIIPIAVENPPDNMIEENNASCGEVECEDILLISVENPQDNVIAYNTLPSLVFDQCEYDNTTEGVNSEMFDGIRLAESVIPFKEVNSLENFNIIVDGFIINSEFPEPVLAKYYDLCCSQNAYLHEHLLEGLNWQLITGVISETTTIAEAIRTCKASTLECHFPAWNKTLNAFEVFGMNVGFLRTRLEKLASLTSESKRGKEMRDERKQAEVEMRSLEAKLLEAKKTKRKLDSEIEALSVSPDNLEDMLQEMAKVPW